MKYLSALFLISFVAVAIFGFAGLDHHNSFSQCASSLLPQSMPCSEDSGMAVAHANIYHAFTQATISILLALALLFAIAIFFTALESSNAYVIKLPFVDHLRLSYSYQKQSDWFAHLEKRDPSLI